MNNTSISNPEIKSIKYQEMKDNEKISTVNYHLKDSNITSTLNFEDADIEI
jgi:hypothetical protein